VLYFQLFAPEFGENSKDRGGKLVYFIKLHNNKKVWYNTRRYNLLRYNLLRYNSLMLASEFYRTLMLASEFYRKKLIKLSEVAA